MEMVLRLTHNRTISNLARIGELEATAKDQAAHIQRLETALTTLCAQCPNEPRAELWPRAPRITP